MNDRIGQLAEQAKLLGPGSRIGNAHEATEKFAELLIQECIACCGAQADKKSIRKRFGLPIESNVKYASPDPQSHHTQYGREYDKPGQ